MLSCLKKNKILTSFFILFALLFGFESSLKSQSNNVDLSKDSIIKEKLNKDYLKKNPDEYYILGSGDAIDIVVSPEYPELNQKKTIDGDGRLILSKLNRVYVKGLTVDELNELLNDAYKEYVKYPLLQTTVINYRPIKIYVDGEVANPGFHTLQGYTSIKNEILNKNIDFIGTQINSNDIDINDDEASVAKFNNTDNLNTFYFPTVFDVIRKAGGLTYFSDITNVELIRINNLSNGGGLKKTSLNFNKVFDGDASQNLRVYDGDRIIIKRRNELDKQNITKAIRSNINPKYIDVYVNGRVNIPGKKTLPKVSTLNDVLLISGGPKVIKGNVNLISFSNQGMVEKKVIKYKKNARNGSKQNPFLKHNDIVYVWNNLLSTSAEVIEEVSKPFQGLLSTYGLIKAFD